MMHPYFLFKRNQRITVLSVIPVSWFVLFSSCRRSFAALWSLYQMFVTGDHFCNFLDIEQVFEILLINQEWGHYRKMSDWGLDVLTGQYQGWGLRFPCNERTDEVNKLVIIWLFYGNKNKKKWHVEGGLFFLFRIVELILWMFLGLNIFVSLYGAIIERKRFAKSFVAVLTRILKYPRTSQGITLYSVQDCSLPNGCFPKIQVCTKSHPDPSGFFFFHSSVLYLLLFIVDQVIPRIHL